MMEGTTEMSDSDSGIILHSGSDSPTSHSKDVPTHTRAMKLKHQALQERLERCLLELRQLCIREAELTGKLSEDFPLKPGERPPQIRRRVGAAFKLDELSIPHKAGASDLNSADAELALQMKIYEAARRLCDEERIGKAVRKSRIQQCKREELKLKALQETAFKLRLEHGRTSPLPAFNITQPDQGTSDDSSLSDSVVQDEEVSSQSSQLLPSEADALLPPLSAPSTPCSSLHSGPRATPQSQSPRPSLDSTLSLTSSLALDDPPPIQHSPWSESNLDQPFVKKKSRSSSKKSTPAKTEVLPPLEQVLPQAALTSQLSHLKLSRSHSNSTPSTPEMRVHRQLSLRLSGPESPYSPDKERGRTRSARRRLTEYSISFTDPPPPAPSPSSLNNNNYNNHHAGSEDSNSDHSYSSYNSSPCHESPCELPKQYHSVFSNGSYQPQVFPQNSYYLAPKPCHKAYYNDEMVYPAEMDMGRSYYAQPPISSRYEYWYKEPNVQPQYPRGQRAPEVRAQPAPQANWEQHPRHAQSYRAAGGLPKQVVNEQLKSWHRRSSQLKAPRSRSLDRQGAVRFKNTASPMVREMHGYQAPKYQEQVIPRRPQRPLDDASEHWLVDDGTHYISQV